MSEPRSRDRFLPIRAAGMLAGLVSLIGLGALLAPRRGVPVAQGRRMPGHETSDLPAGWAALAIAGLISLIGVGALVAWAMTAAFRNQAPPARLTGFEQVAAIPPAPRLEVDAKADRLALERRAEAHLAGYGWADRPAGLAHIPLARAMALQATLGWPDADSGPTRATAPASNAISTATNAAAAAR
jgi:hypothetical protein